MRAGEIPNAWFDSKASQPISGLTQWVSRTHQLAATLDQLGSDFMKLWQVPVAGLLLALAAFIIGTALSNRISQIDEPTPRSEQYSQGVNDALMGLAMLDLEQNLQSTNRTYERMFEIVCSRLRVEYKNPGSKSKDIIVENNTFYIPTNGQLPAYLIFK